MKRYRKLPVEIDAVVWNGSNLYEVTAFIEGQTPNIDGRYASDAWDEYTRIVKDEGLKIITLEGPMLASIGDYIIKGIKGEFYPCKPDIFEATYEAVE